MVTGALAGTVRTADMRRIRTTHITNMEDRTMNTTTYRKTDKRGINKVLSMHRAPDSRYMAVEIMSHKGLDIIDGSHIWIPVDEFKRLVDNLEA